MVYVQYLAKVNSWKLFWIFSENDIAEHIDEIASDPENTLLVFNIQDVDEVMTKSLMRTILALIIPNQPIELNGKYYHLNGLKSIAVMNEF